MEEILMYLFIIVVYAILGTLIVLGLIKLIEKIKGGKVNEGYIKSWKFSKCRNCVC